uniref:Palmitoyltransferase n=1 Tax=Schistocephalus solidus TaxID=70667 RepID=A0A0X3NRU9_SCHSO
MDKSPFLELEEGTLGGSDSRLAQENSVIQNAPLNEQTESTQWAGGSNQVQSRSLYPPVVQAGSRFRGQKELDVNTWDEEAAEHLQTMRRTPGDLCDCLRPCRRPLKLRYPPTSLKMVENLENGYPLPRGVVWFVRDCAGGVCMVMTWLLISYAEFVVSAILLPQIQSATFCWIMGIIYHIFAFLAVSSHLKAVFSDPGTIRLGNATKDAVMRIYLATGSNQPIVRCPKCYCIKPPRTHHCSCCKRCVRKMDHHCPWVNNCVGEGNQKFFVLFNLYIFLMSSTALIMVIYFFMSCYVEFGRCLDNSSTWITTINGGNGTLPSTILSISLGFESVLFGLFTMAIGCSQMSSIVQDETSVESLKRDKTAARLRISKREALANVFGRPLSWRCLNPFSPPPPLVPVIPPVSDAAFISGAAANGDLRRSGFGYSTNGVPLGGSGATADGSVAVGADGTTALELQHRSRDVYLV